MKLPLTKIQQHYYKSQKYFENLKLHYQIIKNYLDCIYETIPIETLGIVFDIDEVLLCNTFENSVVSKLFPEQKELMEQNLNPILPGALDLYNYCLNKNFKIFLVSGRKECIRGETIKNLELCDIKNYQGLYLCPDEYRDDLKSISEFKSNCRKDIIKNGYLIVANIGDQISDILNNFSGTHFLIHNPFYYTH